MNKKELISVTDIVSWLYCPRKLYLTRVMKLREPLNSKMLIGKLKHNIIENFSKKEEQLIKRIDKKYDKVELSIIYSEFIKEIAELVFSINKQSIDAFNLSREEVLKKTIKDFSYDLKIRIENIEKKLSEGFLGEELWKNLDSLYVSELKLESENLGLKGRVDRVEIIKKENIIIPYELKTREDKIFHSDEIQLTAYAMLLEDLYKTKIEKGFVESGENKKEIEIKEENKDKVLKIADEIRNLKLNLPPLMQSNFNKCKSCSLNEDCPKL